MDNMSLEERTRQFVSAAVAIWIKHGGTYTELSELSGVNAQTIKKLADNRTIRPSFRTVEAVMKAFGQGMQLAPARRRPEPTRKRRRNIDAAQGKLF